jgi:hypothetical protein
MLPVARVGVSDRTAQKLGWEHLTVPKSKTLIDPTTIGRILESHDGGIVLQG